MSSIKTCISLWCTFSKSPNVLIWDIESITRISKPIYLKKESKRSRWDLGILAYTLGRHWKSKFMRLKSKASGVQLLLDESHTPLFRLFIQASSSTKQSKSLLGDWISFKFSSRRSISQGNSIKCFFTHGNNVNINTKTNPISLVKLGLEALFTSNFLARKRKLQDYLPLNDSAKIK